MPAFSNSSCLKSVFEKLRFRDGLEWAVGLAVGIKAVFLNSSGVVLIGPYFDFDFQILILLCASSLP